MSIGTAHIESQSFRDQPNLHSKEAQRKAFRRARRHSLLVRTLKWMLPATALGIVALYFLPDRNQMDSDLPQIAISSLNLSSEGLKMVNPSFTGQNDKIGKYRIGADYALQQISAPNLLTLHNITAEIEHPDNKTSKLVASKGLYDTKTEQMSIEGVVHITSEKGIEAKLENAEVDVKEQRISTKYPVFMRLEQNTINAGNMTLSTKNKRIQFGGGVKMQLYKTPSVDNTSKPTTTGGN